LLKKFNEREPSRFRVDSDVTAQNSVTVHKLPEVPVSVTIAETRVHGNCCDLLANIRAVPLLSLWTSRIGKEFARREGITY